MRQHLFVAVAADLNEDGTDVGPETRRVLDATQTILTTYGNACVCVMAGRSPRHGVVMGKLMRDYLVRIGCSEDRIRFKEAERFSTDGEMRALRVLIDAEWPSTPLTIYLACRSWHLPRAKAYLLFRLGRSIMRRTVLREWRIESGKPDWLHEILGWGKFILNCCLSPQR